MVHLMVPCFDWGLGPMPGEFTRRGVSKFGNSWFVASGDTPCRHTPKTSQSQTQHSNATSKIPSWPLCLHRKQHCRKNCSDDQCMNVMPAMLILEVPSLCTLLYPCRLHKNVLGVRKGLCRQPHAWQGRAFHSWDAGHTWRVNVEKEFQFHSPWQHNWSCVMFVHLSFTELESTLDFSEQTTCSVVYVCICHISHGGTWMDTNFDHFDPPSSIKPDRFPRWKLERGPALPIYTTRTRYWHCKHCTLEASMNCGACPQDSKMHLDAPSHGT